MGTDVSDAVWDRAAAWEVVYDSFFLPPYLHKRTNEFFVKRSTAQSLNQNLKHYMVFNTYTYPLQKFQGTSKRQCILYEMFQMQLNLCKKLRHMEKVWCIEIKYTNDTHHYSSCLNDFIWWLFLRLVVLPCTFETCVGTI